MSFSLTDAARQVAATFAGAPDQVVQYVKDRYADFRALGVELTDTMHQASLLRQRALAVGNAAVAEDARQRIQFLGSLGQKHQDTLNQIDNLLATLQRVEQGAGFGALPVLPVVVIATATAIVAVMLYLSFHVSEQSQAITAEMRIVNGVADGSIDPDTAQQMITHLQQTAAQTDAGGFGSQISKGALAIGALVVLLAIVVPKLTGERH